MPYLSLVINVDTRHQRDEFGGENLLGVCNEDFLTFGIENKIAAFEGFDKEVIVCIDEHLPISEPVLKYIRNITDAVIIRKHTNEPSFNCYNYLRALFMASGDIICHIDQDTNIFVSGKEYLEEMIGHLDNYSFVSYPSHWTPKAVDDLSFGKRTWASTRFFFCKQDTLKFDELTACVKEPEYGYAKYGDSPRRTNWLEHYLTLCNNDSCFYPTIEPEKGLIFSWAKYEQWTLRRLNELPYNEVVAWVGSKGGIVYPVDVYC